VVTKEMELWKKITVGVLAIATTITVAQLYINYRVSRKEEENK